MYICKISKRRFFFQPPVIHSLPDSTSFLEDLYTNTLLHTINVTDATGDAVTCTLNPNSSIFHVSLLPPHNTGMYYLQCK